MDTISKTRHRIEELIRSGTQVPSDPKAAVCALRKENIHASLAEVEAVIEQVKQAEFAMSAGRLDEVVEPITVSTATKEERMQAIEDLDRNELAEEKRRWATERWVEDLSIPKNRMLRLMKKEFSKVTQYPGMDWGSLSEAKQKAEDIVSQRGTDLVPAPQRQPSVSGGPVATVRLGRSNGNGNPGGGSLSILKKRIIDYIIGDDDPPRGVTISVEVHVETHDLRD